jgi:hypothetical protein
MSELTGLRYDQGKVQLALLPAEPLRQIARVLEEGAKKYSEHNWRGGMRWMIPANCVLRHLFAWLDGEDTDKESGCPHLAHAATNLIFLLQYAKDFPEADDRFKKETA